MDIFAEIYLRYGHLVFGTMMKYLKNVSAAEDVTMQLFEKLGKKILQSEINNFKSWLYVVTKNEALQYLRKNQFSTQEITVELESIDDLTITIDKEIQYELLEKELSQLKEVQQRCIRLFYLEKRSYQEISGKLSLPIKKVKSAIQNGKRNLKLNLENNEVFKSL